jgi:quercetin dioxygenase-like cupin family protein
MRGARGGKRATMLTVDAGALDLQDAWIDGDARARWRSASATTPAAGTRASGSSVLEVDPGQRVPRHTDSAEETIVVLAGAAEVTVGDEHRRLAGGGLALVPAGVPHEIRSVGREPLRLVALYAATEVVTRYEADVQPDGSPHRLPLGGPC